MARPPSLVWLVSLVLLFTVAGCAARAKARESSADPLQLRGEIQAREREWVAAFPAGTAARVSPDVIAGCYRVSVGAWSPPVDPRDAAFSHVPPSIRLDTGAASPYGMPIRPAQGVAWTMHRFSAWRTDTVFGRVLLTWSTGFSGVRGLVLPFTPASLVGELQTFSDVPTTTHTAPLRLRRIPPPC
jgi:hypothetical protein